MPKWLKIVLALIGVGILGLAAIVGSIVWWVSANKDRLVQGTQAAQREGEELGNTHPRSACIDDGMVRLKSCGQIDLPCEVMTKIRLTACMSVAADDGACERFPTSRNLVKEAFLGNGECTRRGQAGSEACARFVQGVADECQRVRGAPSAEPKAP